MLMAADAQEVTLLGMLDMSAAFDCVNHTILLQRLQIGAGLTDVVLEWTSSFLSALGTHSRMSRSPITVGCLAYSLCCSASLKAASCDHCCTHCTLPSYFTSSLPINSVCTCTPMTTKYTSQYVRLNRLSVGFRTHSKSLQFHSFISFIYACQNAAVAATRVYACNVTA